MRLSKSMHKTIVAAVHHSFGNVDVYLFGSRVDDTKQGGDIDIAIDSSLSRTQFRQKKIAFLSYLLRHDFDFKIDVVNYNTTDKLLRSELLAHARKIA